MKNTSSYPTTSFSTNRWPAPTSPNLVLFLSLMSTERWSVFQQILSERWSYKNNAGTNLLFSPPGLLGKASISIGPQVEAATGLTTGTSDQGPLLEETWSRERKTGIMLKTANKLESRDVQCTEEGKKNNETVRCWKDTEKREKKTNYLTQSWNLLLLSFTFTVI